MKTYPSCLLVVCVLLFTFTLQAGETFPGYVKIQNVRSGQFLEASRILDESDNPTDSFHVWQVPENDEYAQQWEIIWLGDNNYKIINREFKKLLAVKNRSRISGADLELEDLTQLSNQIWISDFLRGYHRFTNQNSGRALDLPGGNLAHNTFIKVYPPSEQYNQLWRIIPIEQEFRGQHFIENEHLRVGIDTNSGAAISWISEKGPRINKNLVNTFDRGRYIQQSYYAGEVLSRREEGQSFHWSPFPWNPIQSGDFFKNQPVVMDMENTQEVLYTRTRPLLWDMDNEFAQAYMEQWISLEGNQIVYTARMTRFVADERWGVKPHLQELPALYLIADLHNFYSYTGDHPWTFQLNPLETGKIWEDWTTHESWVAAVDDQLWGVGVYLPGISHFKGGLYLRPYGHSKSDQTSYISPQIKLALQPNDVFEYRCYFIVGRLNEIQHAVYVRKHLEDVRRLQEEDNDDDE